MNGNVRIARELVRLARMLVAGGENFGHYSIDFDKATRTFTVYFILKEDAVESKALQNANDCRDEIESLLGRDELIEVTNIENNQRSFCFTILVDKKKDDEKKKASFGSFRMIVAAPGDEDESGGDDDDSGGDDDSGDDSDGGDVESDAEEQKVDPEEQKKFDGIKNTVKRVCRKYGWDTKN